MKYYLYLCIVNLNIETMYSIKENELLMVSEVMEKAFSLGGMYFTGMFEITTILDKAKSSFKKQNESLKNNELDNVVAQTRFYNKETDQMDVYGIYSKSNYTLVQFVSFYVSERCYLSLENSRNLVRSVK